MMSVYCAGADNYSRLIRRTVVRYLIIGSINVFFNYFRYTVLTIMMVLRQISSKVKKRFPSYDHLVEAGVMTQTEMKALERAQTMTDYPCYWVPVTWASNLVQQAWEQGYIKVGDYFVVFGNQEMVCFRSQDSSST